MEKILKKTQTRDFLFLIVGTILIALSVNWVYDPMGMVTGGVTGLAIALKYLTGLVLPSGGIPVWITNIIFNVPLFIAAFFILGKKFIGKTLFATISLTTFIAILPSVPLFAEDYLLAAVFGGVFSGAGMGLVLATMSTTGGTDLLSMLIHEKKKHLSVPTVLMVVDAAVVILGIFVFGINAALYAIIAVYISAKTSDSILEGLKFAKMAYIISDHHEEIAAEILNDMDRGLTGINVTGMYSNAEKKMLFCVVSKKEMVELIDIVNKKDSKAFVIVSDVREVVGEGFIEFKQ
ncbi:MAG: YitT family protein [Lachnospiraceae bacterium]|nr:YitT family protein [Lachnospiraceae bacterium]